MASGTGIDPDDIQEDFTITDEAEDVEVPVYGGVGNRIITPGQDPPGPQEVRDVCEAVPERYGFITQPGERKDEAYEQWGIKIDEDPEEEKEGARVRKTGVELLVPVSKETGETKTPTDNRRVRHGFSRHRGSGNIQRRITPK